ncbi:MAG: DUF4920 domain-containing protein [Saprospiraceae bacterium]|nr:DUF4920 domain-containing protein [Saprospiraceae bacterium]
MKKCTFCFFMSILTLTLLMTSCKSKDGSSTSSDPSGKYFGEKIEEDGAISYDSLLVAIKSADSVETKVTGLVSGVCQTKGCWMDIVSEKDSTAESMFVEFKDYAFFMPKDLAGTKVVISGKAYRDVTSVEDLKHYAEDEGQSPEEIAKITEAKEELKFMASGVKILN